MKSANRRPWRPRHSSTRTRHLVVLAATTLTVTLAGCAPIPAEHTPRTIDPAKVPELFPTTTSAQASAATRIVCFVLQRVDEDPKVTCNRQAVAGANVRGLITTLAQGTDDRQHDLGLLSYLPQNTRLIGPDPTPVDGILTVNLTSAFNEVSSPNNTLAFEQIVLTLTNEANGLGASAIQIEVDGKPIKIQTTTGQVATAGPDDFKPQTTTTVAPTTVAPTTTHRPQR